MASVEWKFVLVNSKDLSRIGELSDARGKSLSLGLNKPGSGSFTYPFDGELAASIKVIETGIIAYRKCSKGAYAGKFKLIWSGYVTEITDDGAAENMQVSCVGWFERLNKRIAKQEVMWTSQYDNDIIMGTGMVTPSSATGFTCPSGILPLANLTTANPSGPQTISVTFTTSGTVTPVVGPGDPVSNGTTIATSTASGSPHKSSINGYVISISGTKNTPYTYTASGTYQIAYIGHYYSIPSGAYPSGSNAYPLPVVSGSNPNTLTWLEPGAYASGTTITPSGGLVQKNFKIEQDESFGAAITRLTEQENGPDIDVSLDEANGKLVRRLNVYVKKGSKKENVYFAFNWGPSNVESFTQSTSTSELANNLIGRATGVSPVMLATASGSLDKYGLFESVVNLNQAAPNSNSLQYYTAAEYLFTSTPDVSYSITPFPFTVDSSIPEPFVDYDIGDQVKFRARKDPRINVSGSFRIFGINVSITDDGNEIIGELQIYYNS